MWYQNLSKYAKTFFGVTFQPGEIKEVSGTINHKDFYVVNPPKKEKKQEPPKVEKVEKKPAPKPANDTQELSSESPKPVSTSTSIVGSETVTI